MNVTGYGIVENRKRSGDHRPHIGIVDGAERNRQIDFPRRFDHGPVIRNELRASCRQHRHGGGNGTGRTFEQGGIVQYVVSSGRYHQMRRIARKVGELPGDMPADTAIDSQKRHLVVGIEAATQLGRNVGTFADVSGIVEDRVSAQDDMPRQLDQPSIAMPPLTCSVWPVT